MRGNMLAAELRLIADGLDQFADTAESRWVYEVSVTTASGIMMHVEDLTEDLLDFYEERAAIREFDGGYSRAAAERLAWDETMVLMIQRRRDAKPD